MNNENGIKMKNQATVFVTVSSAVRCYSTLVYAYTQHLGRAAFAYAKSIRNTVLQLTICSSNLMAVQQTLNNYCSNFLESHSIVVYVCIFNHVESNWSIVN